MLIPNNHSLEFLRVEQILEGKKQTDALTDSYRTWEGRVPYIITDHSVLT